MEVRCETAGEVCITFPVKATFLDTEGPNPRPEQCRAVICVSPSALVTPSSVWSAQQQCSHEMTSLQMGSLQGPGHLCPLSD